MEATTQSRVTVQRRARSAIKEHQSSSRCTPKNSWPRTGRYRGATFLQLARRDDRVFYRVEGTSEGRCFAIADDDSLGQITCDLAPRSADVVDMSILDVTESARAQLVVLAGVAPDRVARIDVVGPGNVVINSVDVIANVYFWRPAEPVSGVAANVVSRDGAVIRSLWRR